MATKGRSLSADASLAGILPPEEVRPRALTDSKLEGAAALAPVSSAPTTVMLRNIPNQYSRDMLCDVLNQQGFAGRFDFVYLPIDRNSERNMGYAFINFTTGEACKEFFRTFGDVLASKVLPGFKSSKVCEVRVAEVQGQQANLEKMTSPSFFQHLADREEWQPIFFDQQGERMAIAAKEQTSRASGRRGGKRASKRQTNSLSGSVEMDQCHLTPVLMPFMASLGPPAHGLPGPLSMAVPGTEFCHDVLLAKPESCASEASGSSPVLSAQAPEFVPGVPPTDCLGPAESLTEDMAARHLAAEAAARRDRKSVV